MRGWQVPASASAPSPSHHAERGVPHRAPDRREHVVARPDGAVGEADLVAARLFAASQAQRAHGERGLVGGGRVGERRGGRSVVGPECAVVVVMQQGLGGHRVASWVAVRGFSGQSSRRGAASAAGGRSGWPGPTADSATSRLCHIWMRVAAGRAGLGRRGPADSIRPWIRRPRPRHRQRQPARSGQAAVGRGAAALAMLLLLALGVAVLVPMTPPVDNVLKARDERPSVLLAADGSLLATFRRMNREWITLDAVPPHVVEALIATEDHRFWQHPGIDWRRSIASVFKTDGRRPPGRLDDHAAAGAQLLPRGDRPRADRDAQAQGDDHRDQAGAGVLQARDPGDLPQHRLVPLQRLRHRDGRAHLLQQAGARAHRGRRRDAGRPAEGHARLQPGDQPGAGARAAQRGAGADGQARQARRGGCSSATASRPLRLEFVRQDLDTGPAPHFADTVRRWLAGWGELLGYDLYADGLVVQSTLDPRLQRLANQAVARRLDALQAVADVEWGRASGRLLSTSTASYERARRSTKPFAHFWSTRADLVDAFVREAPEFARLVDAGRTKDEATGAIARRRGLHRASLRARKTRLESGLVALDPASGQVRPGSAAATSTTDSFDHVQQARRQPGSTFKPFVYGAALESGMEPQREFTARAVSIRLPDGSVWRPRDAGDAGHGQVDAGGRTGLFAQHHHRAGDGGGGRGQGGAVRAAPGRAREQARRGAVARARHQPGEPAGDDQRLRHHRRARRIPRAAAGQPRQRPPRQGAGAVRAAARGRARARARVRASRCS